MTSPVYTHIKPSSMWFGNSLQVDEPKIAIDFRTFGLTNDAFHGTIFINKTDISTHINFKIHTWVACQCLKLKYKKN